MGAFQLGKKFGATLGYVANLASQTKDFVFNAIASAQRADLELKKEFAKEEAEKRSERLARDNKRREYFQNNMRETNQALAAAQQPYNPDYSDMYGYDDNYAPDNSNYTDNKDETQPNIIKDLETTNRDRKASDGDNFQGLTDANREALNSNYYSEHYTVSGAGESGGHSSGSAPDYDNYGSVISGVAIPSTDGGIFSDGQGGFSTKDWFNQTIKQTQEELSKLKQEVSQTEQKIQNVSQEAEDLHKKEEQDTQRNAAIAAATGLALSGSNVPGISNPVAFTRINPATSGSTTTNHFDHVSHAEEIRERQNSAVKSSNEDLNLHKGNKGDQVQAFQALDATKENYVMNLLRNQAKTTMSHLGNEVKSAANAYADEENPVEGYQKQAKKHAQNLIAFIQSSALESSSMALAAQAATTMGTALGLDPVKNAAEIKELTSAVLSNEKGRFEELSMRIARNNSNVAPIRSHIDHVLNSGNSYTFAEIAKQISDPKLCNALIEVNKAHGLAKTARRNSMSAVATRNGAAKSLKRVFSPLVLSMSMARTSGEEGVQLMFKTQGMLVGGIFALNRLGVKKWKKIAEMGGFKTYSKGIFKGLRPSMLGGTAKAVLQNFNPKKLSLFANHRMRKELRQLRKGKLANAAAASVTGVLQLFPGLRNSMFSAGARMSVLRNGGNFHGARSDLIHRYRELLVKGSGYRKAQLDVIKKFDTKKANKLFLKKSGTNRKSRIESLRYLFRGNGHPSRFRGRLRALTFGKRGAFGIKIGDPSRFKAAGFKGRGKLTLTSGFKNLAQNLKNSVTGLVIMGAVILVLVTICSCCGFGVDDGLTTANVFAVEMGDDVNFENINYAIPDYISSRFGRIDGWVDPTTGNAYEPIVLKNIAFNEGEYAPHANASIGAETIYKIDSYFNSHYREYCEYGLVDKLYRVVSPKEIVENEEVSVESKISEFLIKTQYFPVRLPYTGLQPNLLNEKSEYRANNFPPGTLSFVASSLVFSSEDSSEESNRLIIGSLNYSTLNEIFEDISDDESPTLQSMFNVQNDGDVAYMNGSTFSSLIHRYVYDIADKNSIYFVNHAHDVMPKIDNIMFSKFESPGNISHLSNEKLETFADQNSMDIGNPQLLYDNTKEIMSMANAVFGNNISTKKQKITVTTSAVTSDPGNESSEESTEEGTEVSAGSKSEKPPVHTSYATSETVQTEEDVSAYSNFIVTPNQYRTYCITMWLASHYCTVNDEAHEGFWDWLADAWFAVQDVFNSGRNRDNNTFNDLADSVERTQIYLTNIGNFGEYNLPVNDKDYEAEKNINWLVPRNNMLYSPETAHFGIYELGQGYDANASLDSLTKSSDQSSTMVMDDKMYPYPNESSYGDAERLGVRTYKNDDSSLFSSYFTFNHKVAFHTDLSGVEENQIKIENGKTLSVGVFDYLNANFTTEEHKKFAKNSIVLATPLKIEGDVLGLSGGSDASALSLEDVKELKNTPALIQDWDVLEQGDFALDNSELFPNSNPSEESHGGGAINEIVISADGMNSPQRYITPDDYLAFRSAYSFKDTVVKGDTLDIENRSLVWDDRSGTTEDTFVEDTNTVATIKNLGTIDNSILYNKQIQLILPDIKFAVDSNANSLEDIFEYLAGSESDPLNTMVDTVDTIERVMNAYFFNTFTTNSDVNYSFEASEDNEIVRFSLPLKKFVIKFNPEERKYDVVLSDPKPKIAQLQGDLSNKGMFALLNAQTLANLTASSTENFEEFNIAKNSYFTNCGTQEAYAGSPILAEMYANMDNNNTSNLHYHHYFYKGNMEVIKNVLYHSYNNPSVSPQEKFDYYDDFVYDKDRLEHLLTEKGISPDTYRLITVEADKVQSNTEMLFYITNTEAGGKTLAEIFNDSNNRLDKHIRCIEIIISKTNDTKIWKQCKCEATEVNNLKFYTNFDYNSFRQAQEVIPGVENWTHRDDNTKWQSGYDYDENKNPIVNTGFGYWKREVTPDTYNTVWEHKIVTMKEDGSYDEGTWQACPDNCTINHESEYTAILNHLQGKDNPYRETMNDKFHPDFNLVNHQAGHCILVDPREDTNVASEIRAYIPEAEFVGFYLCGGHAQVTLMPTILSWSQGFLRDNYVKTLWDLDINNEKLPEYFELNSYSAFKQYVANAHELWDYTDVETNRQVLEHSVTESGEPKIGFTEIAPTNKRYQGLLDAAKQNRLSAIEMYSEFWGSKFDLDYELLYNISMNSLKNSKIKRETAEGEEGNFLLGSSTLKSANEARREWPRLFNENSDTTPVKLVEGEGEEAKLKLDGAPLDDYSPSANDFKVRYAVNKVVFDSMALKIADVDKNIMLNATIETLNARGIFAATDEDAEENSEFDNRYKRVSRALASIGKIGYSQADHGWSYNNVWPDADRLVYNTDCTGYMNYLLGFTIRTPITETDSEGATDIIGFSDRQYEDGAFAGTYEVYKTGKPVADEGSGTFKWEVKDLHDSTKEPLTFTTAGFSGASDIAPGDLLFSKGHVMMFLFEYDGNLFFAHCSAYGGKLGPGATALNGFTVQQLISGGYDVSFKVPFDVFPSILDLDNAEESEESEATEGTEDEH